MKTSELRSSMPPVADGSQPSPMVRMRLIHESGANQVLEHLMFDVSHAALHAAVIASCFNGLPTGQTTVDLRCTQDLAPSEPALVFALRQGRGMIEANLSIPSTRAIGHMFEAIANARGELDSLFKDAEGLGEYRAIVVHGRIITMAWRDACRASETALEILAQQLATLNPGAELLRAMQLKGLLAQAAAGACPCLDEKGLPALVTLPRRPRAVRYAIGQPCKIFSPDGLFEAYAKDISAAGMSLDRVTSIRVNETVKVVLDNGRSFTGTVAWATRSAAGLQFTKKLPLSDPLLAG